VVNEAPLSYILNNPEAKRCFSLWGIELSPLDDAGWLSDSTTSCASIIKSNIIETWKRRKKKNRRKEAWKHRKKRRQLKLDRLKLD
jgi:hypothetical protein